jgi:hypothetical protein
MTPAAKAFVEAGLAKYLATHPELGNQVRLPADQLQKLTPWNSSVPSSFEHSHAKPKRNPLPGRNANRAARTDANSSSERWS